MWPLPLVEQGRGTNEWPKPQAIGQVLPATWGFSSVVPSAAELDQRDGRIVRTVIVRTTRTGTRTVRVMVYRRVAMATTPFLGRGTVSNSLPIACPRLGSDEQEPVGSWALPGNP